MSGLVFLNEVAEAVELDGEVDVVNDDFFGDLEDGGGEVEDGLNAFGDEAVSNFLSDGSWDGEDGDFDVFFANEGSDFVHSEDLDSEVAGAFAGWLGVEGGDDFEAFASEAAVSEEGAAEMTCADEDDGLEACGAEDVGEFFGESGDGVAEAAGSEVADVGEVFAKLGGFDAGGAGEGDGGDGIDAVGTEALERAVIDGHPVDGLFGNRLPERCGSHFSDSL